MNRCFGSLGVVLCRATGQKRSPSRRYRYIPVRADKYLHVPHNPSQIAFAEFNVHLSN